MRTRGGYLAAVLGCLGGGAVGVTLGQLLGVVAATWAWTDFQESGDSEATGFDAAVEAMGMGVLGVLLGILVFFLVVVLTAWLGTVIGCAVALRIAGQAQAGLTALTTGALVLPMAWVCLWLYQQPFGPTSGSEGWGPVVVAAGLSALAARRITLSRGSPPTPVDAASAAAGPEP